MEKPDLQELSKKADRWFDPLLDIWRKSTWSTAIAVAFIVATFFAGFSTKACATGGGEDDGGASTFTESHSTASSSSSSVSSATGGGGAVSQSTTNKAYGAGSTGLTSTAPCLGSVGVLFNAFSATVPQEGCVLRLYAEKMCQDDVCRRKLACLDPDLIGEAKVVLGCPQQ